MKQLLDKAVAYICVVPAIVTIIGSAIASVCLIGGLAIYSLKILLLFGPIPIFVLAVAFHHVLTAEKEEIDELD